MTAYTSFGYISSVRKERALLEINTQLKKQTEALQIEKQKFKERLSKELEQRKVSQEKVSWEREYLEASQQRMAKLFTEVSQLSLENSTLKTENLILKGKKDELAAQLVQVSGENNTLKTKLDSILGLEKALRELKVQAYKVSKEIRHKADSQDTAQGNRGFLLKNGKPFSPAKVKIEVTPASLTPDNPAQ